MTRHSVQSRDRIFVKGYGFLSSAKNMGENNGIYITKNLSGQYSQDSLDNAKKFATDALKTASKRVLQKTAEGTGDLIGNKITNRITKVSNILQRNNSETVTNEHDKGKPKERFSMQKKDKKLFKNWD